MVPPMLKRETPRFGLIGTVTQDVITQASGGVLSGLGGILYQAAGLCGLGQSVTLHTNVSRDIFPRVISLIDGWPSCDGAAITKVPGPGNKVFLHYPEEGERIEILESHVPPLRPERLLEDLPRIGFLILVINSGFDITLPDWRRVVNLAGCPIWLDIHSLPLTPELHLPRRYRPLPEWEEWAEGVTYLQANLKEVAAMLGEPERFPTRERLRSFGETALKLGVRGAETSFVRERRLRLWPAAVRSRRRPSARNSPPKRPGSPASTKPMN
jgi:hypothetical protein